LKRTLENLNVFFERVGTVRTEGGLIPMKSGLKAAFIIAAVSISAVILPAESFETTQASLHKRCAGIFVEQPLVALNESGITGEARLCYGSSGVRSEMVTRNLTPGSAYSIWFAYIDKPSMCVTPDQCAALDFYVGHDPVAVFGRTDSVVASRTHAVFSGNVRTLRLSSGSQVWLVGHFHGPASVDDNRELSRQLLTPQDPIFGVPAGGALVDMVDGHPKGRPAFIAIFTIP
jgi:hypothetical protein